MFHPGGVSGGDDANHSWSATPFHGKQAAAEPDVCTAAGHPKGYCRFVQANGSSTPDADLVDGAVAAWAMATLEQVQADRSSGKDARPFFVAAGFQ